MLRIRANELQVNCVQDHDGAAALFRFRQLLYPCSRATTQLHRSLCAAFCGSEANAVQKPINLILANSGDLFCHRLQARRHRVDDGGHNLTKAMPARDIGRVII